MLFVHDKLYTISRLVHKRQSIFYVHTKNDMNFMDECNVSEETRRVFELII